MAFYNTGQLLEQFGTPKNKCCYQIPVPIAKSGIHKEGRINEESL